MGHDAVRTISERRRDGLWFTGLERRVVVGEGAAAAGGTVGENGIGESVVGERGSGGTGGIDEEDEGAASSNRNAGIESRRRSFEFPNRWTILENRRRRPRGASGAAAGDDISAETEAADSDERV